jgi:hypothetical protein
MLRLVNDDCHCFHDPCYDSGKSVDLFTTLQYFEHVEECYRSVVQSFLYCFFNLNLCEVAFIAFFNAKFRKRLLRNYVITY